MLLPEKKFLSLPQSVSLSTHQSSAMLAFFKA